MNSNGHRGGTEARLRALLEEYQRKADALQTALDLLTGDAVETKVQRHPAVLRAALQAEAVRHEAPAHTPKKHNPTVDERAQNRRRSLKLLHRFNRTNPTTFAAAGIKGLESRGLSGLLVHGYIVKKGDGYIRSDKEFVP